MTDQKKPLVFISHRHDDRDAALALEAGLKEMSDRLRVYNASALNNGEGPQIGKPLTNELKTALGTTSLVLLLFTVPDEDWSYCLWECGVATDPNDEVPTDVVVIQLGARPPKVYSDTLVVKANDLNSIHSFVIQLCTKPRFFPDLDTALTNRNPKDPILRKQAQELYDALSSFTSGTSVTEYTRWGGFTITVPSEVLSELRRLKAPPEGELLKRVLEAAALTRSSGWGLEHFGYTNLERDTTLATLRARWLEDRDALPQQKANDTPWSSIIAEEVWRIVSNRPTRLTWEPFLSLKQEGLWAYPVVYKYRKHASGYDFDLLIIQTLAPQQFRTDDSVPAGNS